MLSKYDIETMTDGQREILAVGMKMEQDRILKILEEEKASLVGLKNHIASASLALIEAKIKIGGFK
jgi:UPF0288 family protein (methanogenesis marker protein 3)